MSDDIDKPVITRRDFLRRAGKEAAETGARLAPGAAVARVVLGKPASSSDGQTAAAPAGILGAFLKWRRGRATSEPIRDEETPHE